jgi:hypothetical protein
MKAIATVGANSSGQPWVHQLATTRAVDVLTSVVDDR